MDKQLLVAWQVSKDSIPILFPLLCLLFILLPLSALPLPSPFDLILIIHSVLLWLLGFWVLSSWWWSSFTLRWWLRGGCWRVTRDATMVCRSLGSSIGSHSNETKQIMYIMWQQVVCKWTVNRHSTFSGVKGGCKFMWMSGGVWKFYVSVIGNESSKKRTYKWWRGV